MVIARDSTQRWPLPNTSYVPEVSTDQFSYIGGAPFTLRCDDDEGSNGAVSRASIGSFGPTLASTTAVAMTMNAVRYRQENCIVDDIWCDCACRLHYTPVDCMLPPYT